MYADIPIEKIKLLRQRLRRVIEEYPIRQLAESIALYGLLNPITVRALEDGSYELIAGVRRLEAIKLLNRTSISCHVIPWDGQVESLAIVENIIRVDLNPLEEAEIIRYMTEVQGLSPTEISEKTHHSRTWINDRLMILNLPQECQDAIAKKQISIGAAGLLARIDDEDYRKYLVHIACTNGATVQQAEAWVMDWSARRLMSGDATAEQMRLQLPPLPPPQKQPCLLCDAQLDPAILALVRMCPECLMDIKTTKSQTKT